MIIHYLVLVASFVAAIQGGRNCGANPSMIYLKRGDKSSVEYWVPTDNKMQTEPEEELTLQSRFDEFEEDEEEIRSAPLLSSTGGLTTWRTNDEQFAIEWNMTTTSIPAITDITVSTERMPISDSIQVAEFEHEETTGLTALKVTDDVTISPHATAQDAVPADASDALTRVNDHVQPETTEQLSMDVTESPTVDITEHQTTELPINQQLGHDGQELDEALYSTEDVPIFTTVSPTQEFNMESITIGTQLMDIEIKTKAELLENIMQQEELRPHTLRPQVSVKNEDSISIENADLVHPAAVIVATESIVPPPTEQPTEMVTDSIQIEIAKSEIPLVELPDVISQLKNDFQDIAHILMSVPDLPQAENQVKEVETTETNELEQVTLAEFKSDLEFAVDTHAEEIETATFSTDLVAKITRVQTEEPEIFSTESILPIQQEESSVHSLNDLQSDEITTEMSNIQLKQSEGSGMDPAEKLIPIELDEPESNAVQGSDLSDTIQEISISIPANQIEDEAEGSGGLNIVKNTSSVEVELPAMDEPEIKVEQDGRLEIMDVVEVNDQVLVNVEPEGSGSDDSAAIKDIDRSDEPVVAVIEDESPPEFRNDDILLNRIRTIVNSLTNPKDTSSSFLRRTSGLLQSVFKRNKRSTTDPVDLVNSPAFRQFLRTQPLPIRRALSPNFSGRFSRQMTPSESEIRDDAQSPGEEQDEECDLHIKTDPGLHLLLTFHNMSAPYTLDCAGAYVEIEREGNGFEARWCGKPIGQRGVRSHVIFARSEVRVSVYNNKHILLKHQVAVGGEGNNSLESQPLPVNDQLAPTGFSADIEVIDLHDAGQFTSFQRSQAYSNVHRRIG